MSQTSNWVIADEVEHAISSGDPVVALESTLIVHGLPSPRNLEVAEELEAIVREAGAVPATIAVVGGVPHIGVSANKLAQLANSPDVRKLAPRDLAMARIFGESGATTVASTAFIAQAVGINCFATGGLGGVHRGYQESFDESNDLTTLAATPIVVVSSGVKSILDVAATLERMESLGIGLVGYQTDFFPGFYLSATEFRLEWRCESAHEIAQVFRQQRKIGVSSALVVANPIKPSAQLDPSLHEELLTQALAAANANDVSGKAITPFLLEYFHTNSAGQSLHVNVEIVKGNARLAAEIASSLAPPSDI
jgi:pseudouridine-5'-phosphate glycosidase